MAEINDLNTTDANNTARFPEGQNPSTVNNGARALEGMMARAFDDVINGAVTTAGTGTAYTLAPNRTIGAYYDGLTFMVKFHAVSGASPTINVSSLGAKNLIWPDGGAVAANELSANSRTLIQYDGTSFQVLFMPATRRVTETFTFTAAEDATSVSGSDDDGKTLAYTAGQIRVLLNGVLLDDSDYTATNGTSITGLAALAEDDILHIETFDNVAAVGSMASQNKDAVDIDGGSIDAATLTNIPSINGVTPATAQYTTAEETKLSGLNAYADIPLVTAYLNSDKDNVTGDGTVYTVAYDAELFDQGSDFNTGTYTFTAPVTGKYQVGLRLNLHDLTTSHTRFSLVIVTSNRNYQSEYNPAALKNSINYASFSESIVVDMDASDTLYVTVAVSGGTKVASLQSGSLNLNTLSILQVA